MPFNQQRGWLRREVSWIAVHDELPKVGKCVIACDSSGRVGEAFLSKANKWIWMKTDDAKNITHWMEFPGVPAQFELNRVASTLSQRS